MPLFRQFAPEFDESALPRGVYDYSYCGRHVYLAMRSDGRWLQGVFVPIGTESDADAEVRAWATLNASDPIWTRPHLTLLTSSVSAPLPSSVPA